MEQTPGAIGRMFDLEHEYGIRLAEHAKRHALLRGRTTITEDDVDASAFGLGMGELADRLAEDNASPKEGQA